VTTLTTPQPIAQRNGFPPAAVHALKHVAKSAFAVGMFANANRATARGATVFTLLNICAGLAIVLLEIVGINICPPFLDAKENNLLEEFVAISKNYLNFRSTSSGNTYPIVHNPPEP
jgi:hypothetical protein